MKIILPLMSMAAGILLAGCATGKNEMTLSPVGPSEQPVSTGASTGTLTVYSAYKRNADFNERDVYRPEYSDYRLLATDGSLLREVHNNSGSIFQDVASVQLAPGQYKVVARANGYGYVTVPVIVQANHSTVLHLEGGGHWGDESAFNQTNSVRLPDGQVVGFRAATN